MNKFVAQFRRSGVVLLCFVATTIPVQAQVTSDGTISTKVTTSDELKFTVTDGSQVGDNLFHSFKEFSVPTGGSVTFNHELGVQNIISRVTGGSISTIDGLIQASGSANLFLINPQGIIFGPNARIDIRGSFLATTANSIKFAKGSFFSATDSQSQPLLTVNTPIGLQFGDNPGNIRNQSQVTRFFPELEREEPVGLEVDFGKTLALMGGEVFLENGLIVAPGGKVELGSVGSSSFVSIVPSSTDWNLGYEGVENFQDIKLSQDSGVDTAGATGSGDIFLRGKRITIDGSQLTAFNDGENPGGKLDIKASESVEVTNSSKLITGAFSNGAAGDITIDTKNLIVRDSSFINASGFGGDGQGGNINIYASDSVDINGNGKLTQIIAQAFADRDAGEVRINTGSLTIRNGGQIGSSTRSAGSGGKVTVTVSESVTISGQGENQGKIIDSGLFARTTGSATGNGGSLNIKTGQLVVQDGGSVSVASVDGSTGQAGNLMIAARTISLNNKGQLTATSEAGKGGGNIILQDLESLTLRGRSKISTNAGGEGNGGDITIRTKLLTALGNSKITANAEGAGNGGNVRIKTQGLFLSPNSEISATSERGVDGVVEIDRLENDPEGALLTLPAEPINISGLIAQGCSSGSVARNSKFVVTGRGGLPPTPKEAFRGDIALADLGKPVETETTQAKLVAPNNQKLPESTPLVEAQGWVISSKGEVILTASAPNVTPSVPWMKSNSCHG